MCFNYNKFIWLPPNTPQQITRWLKQNPHKHNPPPRGSPVSRRRERERRAKPGTAPISSLRRSSSVRWISSRRFRTTFGSGRKPSPMPTRSSRRRLRHRCASPTKRAARTTEKLSRRRLMMPGTRSTATETALSTANSSSNTWVR